MVIHSIDNMNPIIIRDEVEVYQPRKRNDFVNNILGFEQWVEKWKKKLEVKKDNK